MVFFAPSNSLHHSSGQVGKPENKLFFLSNSLAILCLTLNLNTTNLPIKLVNPLHPAFISIKRRVVVLLDVNNSTINSQHSSNYRACTAVILKEIQMTLTQQISKIVYCHEFGSLDITTNLTSCSAWVFSSNFLLGFWVQMEKLELTYHVIQNFFPSYFAAIDFDSV